MTKQPDEQQPIDDLAATPFTGFEPPLLSNRLVFDMQRQQQSYWAWVAVASSVAAYFDPMSRATQCMLANWAFLQTKCCLNGESSMCNRPFQVEHALLHCGNLRVTLPGRGAFPDIVAEIDAGRPVVALIAWASGGTHPVVICGYDLTNPEVPVIAVKDSAFGEAMLTFADFPGNYHGATVVEHTYLTQLHA